MNQLWPTERFGSIQAVLARTLRELMNQLGATERLESLRARAGRIAASRLSWPGG